jgi:hypothetical protein
MEEHRLRLYENRMLRIFGSKRDEDECGDFVTVGN